MITITHTAFAQLLASRKGATILKIVANTAPKVRKTNNPYAEIRKESALTVVTGADYEKGVQNNGGTNFKAAPLPTVPLKLKIKS